ncbi:uncharacterized protein LOC130957728 [Arachis stenosperma]|uniref:uncharacterized protein LOC130957728 n=1 Tax=Arachis stenosperma TaxID=217475 RepID=UPI0025ACBD25|nr:uncharacterized protein LOC130957728 [Arachis stenosperma]
MLEKVGPKPILVREEVQNEEVKEEVELGEDETKDIARGEEDLLKSKEPKRKNPLEEPTPIPFPSVVKKAKKHEELDSKVVQIFKNVEVTVSLFQAIQQIPKYAKFLKDICTHKEKIAELGKSLVSNSISFLIPKKYSDPGPCLVTCVIGIMKFMDCMCDLGACVSIMPLFIYEKLNFAPLRQFGARFVLADKSIVSVVGIAENVLVNIQELLFPVDFHILEIPPIDSDRPSYILLERLLLKTSRFKLDAFLGAYSFEAKEKVVKLTLEGTMKQPHEVYSIFGCDLIEEKVIEAHSRKDAEVIVNKSLNIKGLSKEDEEAQPLPTNKKDKEHISPLKEEKAKHTKELEIFLLGDGPRVDH